MKRRALFFAFFIPVLAVSFFIAPKIAFARSLTASVSGNWDDSATWGGNSKPIAGDTTTINSGITVTVAADAAAASITFPTASAATKVTINSGATLTISGAITLPEGSGAGSSTLAVGSGTASAGSIDFTNAANAKKHSVSISTGTLTVSGNITIDGTNKKSAGLTFTGTGTLNLGGALFSGSNNATLVTTIAGSTINYNASGVQTVRALAYSGNLIFSGSGAKSMASGTSVTGNLSIAPTGSATASIAAGQTLTVGTLKLAGVGKASGTWGSTSSTATNQNNTYFAATSGKLSVTTGSVDTTAPTISDVTSTLANGTYKVGQAIDIVVTFSEAVTSTGNVTVTLDTSRTCTFTVTASSTGTCTYTVQSGDTSSDLTVSSISGTIADAASNSLANFTPTTNLAANKALVIDTTAPTVMNVTSSTTNGSYKVGATVSLQVTFSEAVAVTGTPQLTLETGTPDEVLNYVSGTGGTTLTFTYIVQAGDTSSDLNYTATNALALNSGTILDAATNAATLTLPGLSASGSLATNKAIVIDTTAPTVTNVTSSNINGNYKAGDVIAVQVVFSEAVTVSNTPHITLLTGSPTTKNINYSSGSGTDTLEFDYTVGSNNYTADLDYASIGSLSTSSSGSASTIQDAAGNAATITLPAPGGTGSLGANKNIVIDSIAPTVILSTTAPSLTNVAIPVTATFSETVTGFVVGDITVTNGTAGSFSGSGASYAFIVTPSGQGSVSVSLLASVAQDVGGNLSTVSNTITRTYDSIVPTIALTTPTSSPTLTTPITYTATFSEAVTGFVLSDVSVTNSTVGNFHTVSSRVYAFDISPIGDPILNVDVTVSVNANKAQDAAGNMNTASDSGVPATIRFDNHNPTTALTSLATEFTASSPFSVTATFSESVTEFVVGDITVTNGTAGSFSGSGTTYTFNITPTGQGAVSVSVASGVAHDVALNTNLVSNTLSTTYDTGPPTLVLTTATTSPTNTTPFSVTATFSEDVTGFTVDDVSVTNGAASNFQTISTTTYTFDITPAGQGTVSIDVPGANAQDGAGNNNTAASTLSLTFDSAGPTVTEVTPVTALGTDSTPDYTFNTTEVGTITYGGSCTSSTSSATLNHNTVTFSALANGTYNDCSITVTDAAGNASAPLIITAFTVNNSNPTVASLSPANNATGVSPTTNLVVTFDFDKAVVVGTGNIYIKTGVTTVATIAVTSGSVTGSGTSIITISSGVTLASQTTYYVQIDATAFQDTFGNAYEGISDSTTWRFTTADTTAPTVSSLAPANNGTGASVHPTLVMTFSENVIVGTGFVTIRKADNTIVEDIDVTGNKVTGSGTSVIHIAPSSTLDGSTNYHITISATAFTDTSSNAYAGITDSTTWTFQTLDTSSPYVTTFSPANFATGVSSTANLVMTFDRAVFVQTNGVITIKTGGSTTESITLPDARVTGTGTATITINPTATLSSQTVYYVNIDGTAFNDLTDGTGNSFSGMTDTTTWTFTTLDTTNPTLSSVVLSSNNSLSSSQAKAGDTVTLTFSSSETISTPSVAFTSGTIAITNTPTITNPSPNNWVASYVTSSSDTNGAVGYTITFADTTGNSGTPVTSGTGSVTFDKTAPTLSSVALSSNNSTNTLAKVGNVVTLSFTASETISTPTVSFNSSGAPIANAVTVTNVSPSLHTWTATYTTSSSDTTGDITYSVSAFHDNSNNDGTTVTSGTGSVSFDKTAPTFSLLTPATSAVISNVTSSSVIAFTTSEALGSGSITTTRTSGSADAVTHTCTLKGAALNSGSHVIDLSDTTNSCTSNVSSLVSGTVYTFVFAGSDPSGNTATSVTRTGITFDITAPTLSSVSLTSSNSTTTLAKVGNIITLSFTASETISEPTVSISSGGVSVTNPITVTNTSGNIWTATYTTSSSDTTGGVTYSINTYHDTASNNGSTVTSGSGSVTFDKTAPTITNITSNKANGTYTTGESIDIRVSFSEAVTSTGNVTVTLDTTRTCTFTISSSTLGTCNYIVQADDASSDLTTTSIASILLDAAGNALTNFSPATNLAANKAILIDTSMADTSLPTITDVSSTKANGAYTTGEVIDINVSFSEAVNSTGNVTVTLDTGRTCNFMVTASSSGSCNYTVQAGDTSSDLTVTSIAGTIKDTSNNTMTDFVPATNLAANKAIVIDTSAPTFSSVTPATSASINNVTSSSSIVFTTSEALGGGSVTITRTSGSTDSTVHTCTLKGTALNSGSHTINLSDTTNSCTSAVSSLVSGAVYTFVFAGSDSAGNAATPITRTGVSFTTSAPTLSSVTLVSSNSTNTQAKVGDTITLSFTASTTISTPTVTFSAGGANITNAVTVTNTSANNWTAVYTTSSSDTAGAITYSVSSFHDNADNSGSTVTSGTGSVTFDKTVPSLSSIALVSNHSAPTQARVGNIVTLSFTASETISTPTVSFNAGGVSVTNSVTVTNTSGNHWTATYTTSSSDTNGAVTYSINTYHDNASNSGSTVTTGTGSVNFRKTGPTITSVVAVPSTTHATVTWSTPDVAATTQVVFSPDTSFSAATDVHDTSPRVESHEVAPVNLIACTRYHFKAVSTDETDETATSTDTSFTTTGCSGGATIITDTTTTAVVADASTATLASSGNTIAVDTPANFTNASSSVVIQIKALDSVTVLSGIGKPDNTLTSAASVVFDVKALVDSQTVLDSFDAPVTITYHYSDSEITGLNESTLWMYHYHNNAWLPLTSCVIDTNAKTVTCGSPSFSVFAIFGQTTVVTPQNLGGGGGIPVTLLAQQQNTITPQPATLPVMTAPSIPSPITASCSQRLYPTKVIKYGSKNDPVQVKLLEKYLNAFEHARVPVDGIYSLKDKNAVIQWQEKYADEILKPWGSKKGTGYVYTTSLNKFKSLFLAQCTAVHPPAKKLIHK